MCVSRACSVGLLVRTVHIAYKYSRCIYMYMYVGRLYLRCITPPCMPPYYATYNSSCVFTAIARY